MVASLLSDVVTMFQAHLDISCSRGEISHFSRKPWSLMVGKSTSLKGTIKAKSGEVSF